MQGGGGVRRGSDVTAGRRRRAVKDRGGEWPRGGRRAGRRRAAKDGEESGHGSAGGRGGGGGGAAGCAAGWAVNFFVKCGVAAGKRAEPRLVGRFGTFAECRDLALVKHNLRRVS